MEFALTVPRISRTNDSWQPNGSRSFFVCCDVLRACSDRGQRRIGDSLRLALIAIFGAVGTLLRYGIQVCADRNRRHVSLGHAADQSHRMLSDWVDRTDDAESDDDFSRLAHGDHRGIFWWIHDVFELRLGDGENVGRRPMVASDQLRCGQRVHRAVAIGGRDSTRESILGVVFRNYSGATYFPASRILAIHSACGTLDFSKSSASACTSYSTRRVVSLSPSITKYEARVSPS